LARKSPEFKHCINRGGLTKLGVALGLVGKELEVAKDDLAEAKAGFARGSFKWTTIQAYYAMFHAARALVYKHGYREKSHYCLIVALREFFVRTGKLEEELLLELEDVRSLREEADYRASFSKAGAEQALQAAERFLKRAQELAAA